MSSKDWYPEVLKLRGLIAELEIKFSEKYWNEVGVEMMQLKAEKQRLKQELKKYKKRIPQKTLVPPENQHE